VSNIEPGMQKITGTGTSSCIH